MLEKIFSWFTITGLLNFLYEVIHIEFTRDDLYLITFIWAAASLSNIKVTIKKKEEK